jgi:hypothetical protein
MHSIYKLAWWLGYQWFTLRWGRWKAQNSTHLSLQTRSCYLNSQKTCQWTHACWVRHHMGWNRSEVLLNFAESWHIPTWSVYKMCKNKICENRWFTWGNGCLGTQEMRSNWSDLFWSCRSKIQMVLPCMGSLQKILSCLPNGVKRKRKCNVTLGRIYHNQWDPRNTVMRYWD